MKIEEQRYTCHKDNSKGNEQFPLIAIIGRPNVGKSSLFNRLTKTRTAIVDPTPGVTRDRHYQQITWENRTFILIDTGGLELENSENMAKAILEQSWQAVEEADVIWFLLDGKSGLMPEDYEVVSMLRKSTKPIYCLVNKVDSEPLEIKLVPQFYELGVDQLWPISAAHGYGIGTMMDDLTVKLPIVPIDSGSEDAIRIAFIGRPNVGKSSLINRLLGEERMVVSDIPGTTRDSVDSLLKIKNKSYLLIDTAGIRRKGKVKEKIEKFSVIKALSSLEKCDIALVLINAEEGITEQDTKVIGYCLDRGRACLILINKWDLIKNNPKRQKQILEELDRSTRFVGYAPNLTISALTGQGTKKIFANVNKINTQFALRFTTNKLNQVMKQATDNHSPSLHKGKRLKLYYTTQIGSKPPTFILFANYPKGIHFSYYRYLVNQFRVGLGLDKTPLKLVIRERTRKNYGKSKKTKR
jgi:GTPase